MIAAVIGWRRDSLPVFPLLATKGCSWHRLQRGEAGRLLLAATTATGKGCASLSFPVLSSSQGPQSCFAIEACNSNIASAYMASSELTEVLAVATMLVGLATRQAGRAMQNTNRRISDGVSDRSPCCFRPSKYCYCVWCRIALPALTSDEHRTGPNMTSAATLAVHSLPDQDESLPTFVRDER